MARHERDDWLHAAMERLAAGGVEAVAIEPLAGDLGVTKGSFYWHFRRRQELLDALLETWEEQSTLAVIGRVDATSPDPAVRLRALGELTLAADTATDRVEPALRAWAVGSPQAARVVARVDARRLAYTRDLLVGAGVATGAAAARAEILCRVLIGEWVYRGTGGARLDRTALEDLLTMLLTAPTADSAVAPVSGRG